MSKPPKSEPHSDIDGVHQDSGSGQPDTDGNEDPGEDLARAEEESAGRPERRDHRKP